MTLGEGAFDTLSHVANGDLRKAITLLQSAVRPWLACCTWCPAIVDLPCTHPVFLPCNMQAHTLWHYLCLQIGVGSAQGRDCGVGHHHGRCGRCAAGHRGQADGRECPVGLTQE